MSEPKFGKTALELLESREEYYTKYASLSTKYGVEASGAAIGLGGQMTFNFLNRRPLLSGIHMIALCGVIGGTLGYFVRQYNDQRNAERDAMFRHYIRLHPEDFPPPQRKQYKDVLEEWIPVR